MLVFHHGMLYYWVKFFVPINEKLWWHQWRHKVFATTGSTGDNSQGLEFISCCIQKKITTMFTLTYVTHDLSPSH